MPKEQEPLDLVGTKLGAYEIVEVIGQGGMATVYRAYQPGVDRHVAIKVIRSTHERNRDVIRRFQREARLIARLEHPFIVPLYDFDSGHEPPYIVMRLLDGGTLKDLVENGPMATDRIGNLIHQVAAALDYGHRQGIIHRDVKPSNILLDHEGNALVTDFGIARMVIGPMRERDFTAAGAFIGTPDYMAPEQIRGEGASGAADIYALGVILFQMVTGTLPYDADNPASMLAMHLHSPVPSAVERNPDLPFEFDRILAKALAKNPEERFPTASALAIASKVVLGGTATSAPTYFRPGEEETAGMDTGRIAIVGRPARDQAGEQKRNISALQINVTEFAAMVDERHGSEETRSSLNKLWEMAEPMIREHGGAVVSRTADSLLAMWGVESSREDDAERVIFAAIALRDMVQSLASELSLGIQTDEPPPAAIGINTGIALVSPGEGQDRYSVSGLTTTLSSRLAQKADGGILITHGTYADVRGVFDVQPDKPLTMRGIGQAIPTYRILQAKRRALRLHTRGVEGIETQMVGREAELRMLQNLYLDALEDSQTQIATIVGDAGLGKSRLLYEFSNWAELRPEFFWLLRGQATPAMSNRPYALLRDILSFRFEILDSDGPAEVRRKLESGIEQQIGSDEEMAHLLGHMAGFDFSDSPFVSGWLGEPKELTRRARRFFNRWIIKLSAEDMVVFEVEDIHYADEASLDLLAGLVSEHREIPLILITLARPSLFERRPDWGSGLINHTSIDLRPLDKRASQQLSREILQKLDRIPESLLNLLVDRSEGNPYYLEELVKMLISDRVIVKDSEDSWRVELERLGHLTLPGTLAGLLQVRLDTLLQPEKLTLQRAAVVGRIFSDDALKSLDRADERHVQDLDQVLQGLVEAEFIHRREFKTFEGGREYIFGSKMLREMLLHTLPAHLRRQYNLAAAEWLIAVSADRVDEYSSQIAEYYDRAGEKTQAADWYFSAAEQAKTQGALVEARKYYDTALSLIPKEDLERRWQLLLGRNEVLGLLGLTEARSEDDEALLVVARQLDDDNRQATAFLRNAYTAMTVGDDQVAVLALDQAIAFARRTGNLKVDSMALGLKVATLVRIGDLEAAGEVVDEAVARAEALGDEEILARNLNNVASYYSASGDLSRAARIYQEQATICDRLGQQVGKAFTLLNLGYLYVRIGLFDEGKSTIEKSLDLAQKMGFQRIAAYNRLNLGLVYLYQSDHDAAVEALDEAGKALDEIGDPFGQATCDLYQGLIFEASGEKERASQHFRDSYGRLVDLDIAGRSLDAQAGLARCALYLNDVGKMKRNITTVWEYLSNQGPEGLEFPILAYQSCALVFTAMNDADKADKAINRGYVELKDRSEKISDPEWRRSFIENIPEHRKIIEIWESSS